ncbi:MAG TPA: hypothetical protein VGH11_13225 [Jatrophihabitans sp.]
MHPAYEDDQLRRLTPEEREDLSRRVRAITSELDAGLTGDHRARELFITITAFACLLLVPWVVALAAFLPETHSITHWKATWVGFDIALAAMLGTTTVLAMKRRQSVVLAAFITATLLLCDAWFDVMSATTGSDRALSLVSAVVELSLAAVLFNTVRLFFRYMAQSSRQLQTSAHGKASLGPLQGLPEGLDRLSLRRVARRRSSGRLTDGR